MTTTMTVRGQTVVPSRLRRAYGLTANAKLEWVDDGKCIRVVPLTADPVRTARGVFGRSRLREALLRARAEDRHRG